ncbi:hypothetical protein QCA50_010741 [Cerrena zonata]|uniref:Uncharacterized protein n=1 Tax=Cerrena zonata TaxID=2478898 RepID=A0AAW0G815_9APHY
MGHRTAMSDHPRCNTTQSLQAAVQLVEAIELRATRRINVHSNDGVVLSTLSPDNIIHQNRGNPGRSDDNVSPPHQPAHFNGDDAVESNRHSGLRCHHHGQSHTCTARFPTEPTSPAQHFTGAASLQHTASSVNTTSADLQSIITLLRQDTMPLSEQQLEDYMTYYGTVERQGRMTLHLHFLLSQLSVPDSEQ